MITFASDKCFGLVDLGQNRLEGNTAGDREEETSSAIFPSDLSWPQSG
jgi:hypothetical protein